MWDWDTCPLIFNVNFRVAQSPTATLCWCLSNDIVFCNSSCVSSVAATWTLFSVLGLFHVICDQSFIVLCPSHQVLVTPLPANKTRQATRHRPCCYLVDSCIHDAFRNCLSDAGGVHWAVTQAVSRKERNGKRRGRCDVMIVNSLVWCEKKINKSLCTFAKWSFVRWLCDDGIGQC